MTSCRICDGPVEEFLDLGAQPSANSFLRPDEVDTEFRFRLAVGRCATCTMVQLITEVPAEVRYPDDYRYQASGSASHRLHFQQDARMFLETELTGADAFIVEIGCNDGVMLETIARNGVRHLGVEPAKVVAAVAAAKGIDVRTTFFDEIAATEIRAAYGPADVIFGANTICHIADQRALFRAVDTLLAPDGIFVFEDPYLDTVVAHMAFDQIYDEHVYYFTVRSVQAMAAQFGFELIDAREIPMHGGEIRYTVARRGRRPQAAGVAALIERERERGLDEPAAFSRFAARVAGVRADLVALLTDIRERGATVIGYGAPGKASTVTTYCGIGPDLIPFVCDSTPAKQGLLVPGSHIPVRAPEAFADAKPDYAVLFAWNHADEIMAREQAFRDRGGRWILYVPEVHVI